MNDDLDIAIVERIDPFGGAWHEWKANHFSVDCRAWNCSVKASTDQLNTSSDTLNKVTECAYEGSQS